MRESTVVYATDANYWPHLYVSLYSLLKNNPGRQWRVLIVCDAIDETFARHAKSLTDIEYVSADRLSLDEVPASGRFGRAAFYRIAVDRYVPHDVERVLYLDSDTVIVGCLDELLASDLDNCVIAARGEKGTPRNPKYAERNRRLGVPDGGGTFNTGVLLIDMKRWRERNVERRLLDYIATHGDHLPLADQDAFTAVLYDDFQPLPPAINWLVKKGQEPAGATILHYAGSRKPWLRPCDERITYWRYRQETPYALPPRPSVAESARQVASDAPRMLAYLRDRLYTAIAIYRAKRRVPK